MIPVTFEPTFAGWREKARELLSADVRPEQVLWNDASQPALFSATLPEPKGKVQVPREFLSIAETVSGHRSQRKWALLYSALYRLTHGEPELLKVAIDRDTRQLGVMRHEVNYDVHRMKAFIRFRSAGEDFVAWHKPDHFVLPFAAPWFARRFANMRWSILTPDACAFWDGQKLRYGPGVPRSEAPDGDVLEDLWRAYYASIFNPTRLNTEHMRQHMPQRYWSTLPEVQVLNELVAKAGGRECGMLAAQPASAASFIPTGADLPVLRQAVHACRGCDLWEHATQPVFGEGPADAPLVFVGEQPGDNEDLQGRPFTGPAGQLFERALADAGLRRDEIYITNAVKHFRFEQRGKRRMHKSADKVQVAACQPWLEAELAFIRPRVVVCMGNTAVLSVIGRGVRLLEERGQILANRHAGGALVTVHPSFLLRMPDEVRRNQEYNRFVEDIRTARAYAVVQRTPPLPNLFDLESLAKCS